MPMGPEAVDANFYEGMGKGKAKYDEDDEVLSSRSPRTMN